MSNLSRYQETQAELSRQVRRETARARDQIQYVVEATKEVQEAIANIHKEGTCTAVQVLTGTSVLIQAAQLQGMSDDLTAQLHEMQSLSLELMNRVSLDSSVQLAHLVQQLKPLPKQSTLDALNRFVKDYYE